mmetsp:Transcript_101039/g.253372  ORF Transcript_101039/g.253372 Transcript_101039/m.253372 type:complete len:196 (+) Transcript_101039:93-680(+)
MSCFSCCCTTEDRNQIRVEALHSDEVVTSFSIFDEPPMRKPTLLTSRPTSAMEVGKSRQRLADAEKEGSVDFLTSLVKGRRCKHLSEKTFARMEVEYYVDATRAQMVMKTVGDRQPKMMACPVKSIEDIYTINDGDDCFPKQVMELLTPQEKVGLFMIVHTTDNPFAEVGRVLLIEDSESSRDSLLQQLMNIIRL